MQLCIVRRQDRLRAPGTGGHNVLVNSARVWIEGRAATT